MARPLLLRILPNRFKPSLYYRHYYTRHDAWRHLFKAAPLALCLDVSMHNLVQGDVISGNIAFNGFYELELSRRIAEHATKGGFFVDVGAIDRCISSRISEGRAPGARLHFSQQYQGLV